MMTPRSAGAWLLTSFLLSASAGADDTSVPFAERAEVREWIANVVAKHHLSETHVQNLVANARRRPSVLASAQRPAESMPWYRYRKIFLTQDRIERGRKYLKQHAALFDSVHRTYGLPPEIIAAIIGVETDYGRNTGSHPVVDTLLTLGFDFPRRAEFFRGQLEQLLLLEREAQLDIASLRGSWAGALGLGQFIPGSYRAFAVDADQDGQRDLWNSPPDILASIANYFHQHDWQVGQPIAEALHPSSPDRLPISEGLEPTLTAEELTLVGVTLSHPEAGAVAVHAFEVPEGREYWIGYHNFYVITRYNHSALYALAVYQLSEALRNAPNA